MSCAASYNNRVAPKRRKSGACVDCAAPVKAQRKCCQKCHKALKHTDSRQAICVDTPPESRKKADVIYKSGTRSGAYQYIRYYARKRILERVDSCENCGYSNHIEACHIIPIRAFPDAATVEEINSNENLVGLCPNCHWELDHGKLKLDR